jgi:hypothetical protein
VFTLLGRKFLYQATRSTDGFWWVISKCDNSKHIFLLNLSLVERVFEDGSPCKGVQLVIGKLAVVVTVL